MTRALRRIARMDAAEASWRIRTAARTAVDRARAAVRPPAWDRRTLASRLARAGELSPVVTALRAQQWADAHQLLSRRFRDSNRFVVRPADREAIVDCVGRMSPDAAAQAAQRAGHLLECRYDLLGYHDLVFATESSGASMPDWHYDPVHHRHAPVRFWSTVPYLDPSCGDHKIIWELNRHQHWLALGRAYWLTGNPAYRDRCLDELASWLAANPPLAGINWASMLELALRSVSWVWALHLFACDDDATELDAASGRPWTVDLLLGLDRQLEHVEHNLSYYFSPNTHLLGEALALYVAGRSVPELAASERRAETGRRILVAEIGRQIGDEGGHCERSTHYHRYTLDFYVLALVVARVTHDPIAAVFERAVERLATFARLIADDTGRAPHLGDDDGGMLFPIAGRAVDDWRDSLSVAASLTGIRALRIDSEPEEAVWMLSHPAADVRSQRFDGALLAPRSAALESSGYYVSRSPGEHLVIDGGPHGYLNAGHAHADALALTLSVGGIPLLVDPGTACYTVDRGLRDRFRSTALHNTVELDGRSQSVPSGPFHWSHVADSVTHRWRSTDGFDYFDGSHEGYAPITHRRRVLMLHGDLLVVADHLDGDAPIEGCAVYWHVDPAWQIEADGSGATMRTKNDRVRLIVPHGRLETFRGDASTGLGWHSPVYGRVEPATTIRITPERGDARPPFWVVSVFDLDPLDPIRHVETLPVWAEAGSIAHATGLRATRGRAADYLLLAEPVHDGARATWRVGEFETDARMLCCRVGPLGDVTRIALVDGSIVRSGGRRAVGLALGRTTPALFIDETSIRNFTPCAALPAL